MSLTIKDEDDLNFKALVWVLAKKKLITIQEVKKAKKYILDNK